MNYRPQIAAEIRAEMGRQKYGPVKLAAATRIPRSRLTRRLSGQSPFSTDELGAVAAALCVSVSELIRRAEQVAA